jgi:hypothetical protein
VCFKLNVSNKLYLLLELLFYSCSMFMKPLAEEIYEVLGKLNWQYCRPFRSLSYIFILLVFVISLQLWVCYIYLEYLSWIAWYGHLEKTCQFQYFQTTENYLDKDLIFNLIYRPNLKREIVFEQLFNFPVEFLWILFWEKRKYCKIQYCFQNKYLQ